MSLHNILSAFGMADNAVVERLGNGLINHTWKITAAEGVFVLQKVNDTVFTNPAGISQNLQLLEDYLAVHHPDYPFVAPIASATGQRLVFIENDGYYRLFPFVKASHPKDIAETPGQAYEAARQFGRFTRLLSGFDASRLTPTIPQFHDLGLRYSQFLEALQRGNEQRIRQCKDLIETLLGNRGIVERYEHIKSSPAFTLRVTHHDTKISNVLFDGNDTGLCVIDLDTVMPGYFISDVGDMLRTYISPVSEEETDFAKIEVRDEYVKAIADGYLTEMKDELSDEEKSSFLYAGRFMIYMQALRFLTDHLNDNVYYGAKYPGHNLNRAQNQAILLQRLMEKEDVLKNL